MARSSGIAMNAQRIDRNRTPATSCATRRKARKGILPVPSRARALQRTMVKRLTSLLSGRAASCLDAAFRRSWEEIVALLEEYQQSIISASGMERSCAKGCADCCCHWVEDVNSFEAEIIASFLKKRCPDKLPGIIEACRRGNARLERLDELVDEKLAAVNKKAHRRIDGVDLLLASFYQLQEECPLLLNNECMIYPVRPITCRMYISFSDPVRCNPDYINKGAPPTYLFDPEEAVDRLIDKLHFKFMKFEGDTGLRSLLVKYLS
jgi:Fe-S-cluster containining protein